MTNTQLLAEVHAADGGIVYTKLVERVDPDAEEQIGKRIDDLAPDDWIQVRGGVVTLTEWAEAPAKSFHDQIAEFGYNPLSG